MFIRNDVMNRVIGVLSNEVDSEILKAEEVLERAINNGSMPIQKRIEIAKEQLYKLATWEVARMKLRQMTAPPPQKSNPAE